MLFQCSDGENVASILEYIGEDYAAIPYLYVNLKRYGVSNSHVKVWADLHEDKVCGVYLLYYDTLHFYTKDTQYPESVFEDMLERLNPKVVFTPGYYGDSLEGIMPETYRAEKYYVVDLNVSRPLSSVSGVEIAGKETLEDIAELMLTDPEYKTVYDKDMLKTQLLSRYQDGFSRYFVVRRDERVVAAYSTYGESDKLYILSGLVVHPDYRRCGLGTQIMNFAHRAVAEDGVKGISCLRCSNVATIEIHKKMGAMIIASQYKFIRE